jgi:hypothetical protein
MSVNGRRRRPSSKRERSIRLKVAAAENEMTLTQIAVEALAYWLDHQEEIEDELARRKLARVAAESSGEYIPHEEVKRRLHASARDH